MRRSERIKQAIHRQNCLWEFAIQVIARLDYRVNQDPTGKPGVNWGLTGAFQLELFQDALSLDVNGPFHRNRLTADQLSNMPDIRRKELERTWADLINAAIRDAAKLDPLFYAPIDHSSSSADLGPVSLDHLQRRLATIGLHPKDD